MYNCLGMYIMHNGYHGICTGSLFFMLYLQYKAGRRQVLIGHEVGQNEESVAINALSL